MIYFKLLQGTSVQDNLKLEYVAALTKNFSCTLSCILIKACALFVNPCYLLNKFAINYCLSNWLLYCLLAPIGSYWHLVCNMRLSTFATGRTSNTLRKCSQLCGRPGRVPQSPASFVWRMEAWQHFGSEGLQKPP